MIYKCAASAKNFWAARVFLTHLRWTGTCQLLLAAIWMVAGLPVAGGATRKQAQVTLQDVVPVLLLRCAACHGRQQQDGGLDLRSRESMLKGGESGPVLVPGDPENSLILKRLVAEEMPPRKRLIEASVKPMEEDEIKLLTAWIEAGAPEVENDSQHGDMQPPVSDEDRQTVETAITDALAWLDDNQEETSETYKAKQKEVEGVFMPVMTKIYQSMD